MKFVISEKEVERRNAHKQNIETQSPAFRVFQYLQNASEKSMRIYLELSFRIYSYNDDLHKDISKYYQDGALFLAGKIIKEKPCGKCKHFNKTGRVKNACESPNVYMYDSAKERHEGYCGILGINFEPKK